MINAWFDGNSGACTPAPWAAIPANARPAPRPHGPRTARFMNRKTVGFAGIGVDRDLLYADRTGGARQTLRQRIRTRTIGRKALRSRQIDEKAGLLFEPEHRDLIRAERRSHHDVIL